MEPIHVWLMLRKWSIYFVLKYGGVYKANITHLCVLEEFLAFIFQRVEDKIWEEKHKNLFSWAMVKDQWHLGCTILLVSG